jgi:hypothetical protein
MLHPPRDETCLVSPYPRLKSTVEPVVPSKRVADDPATGVEDMAQHNSVGLPGSNAHTYRVQSVVSERYVVRQPAIAVACGHVSCLVPVVTVDDLPGSYASNNTSKPSFAAQLRFHGHGPF